MNKSIPTLHPLTHPYKTYTTLHPPTPPPLQKNHYIIIYLVDLFFH